MQRLQAIPFSSQPFGQGQTSTNGKNGHGSGNGSGNGGNGGIRFGDLRAMDVAERNLLNDISSLDYALEANKRKRLRSTRSEPNRQSQRAPLAASPRHGMQQPQRRARSQRASKRTQNLWREKRNNNQQQQQQQRSPRNSHANRQPRRRQPQQPQRQRDVGRSPRQPQVVDRMVVVHRNVKQVNNNQGEQNNWEWKQNNQPQPFGANYFQQDGGRKR